jgi:predicted nucleic acid-binding protein
MPDGYLLDNNAISILVRPGDPRHAHVMAKFAAIPSGTRVGLPVMAIGEIEFGMAKVTPGDPAQRAAVRKFFRDHPLHFPVDDGTIEPYALVRAKLWELYGTPKGGKRRGHQEKLPDELRERATGQWIGIDERDLLIVSIALQYNFRFATVDRNEEMKRIERAVAQLVSETKWEKPLHLDDWTPPKPAGT